MKFYTNVVRIGSYIHMRGWDGDERIREKVKFAPTIYIPTNKDSEYQSLDNGNIRRNVVPHTEETMWAMYKYVESRKDLPNFNMYGQLVFEHQFISEEFRDNVEYDISKIRIGYIDIEVDSTNGFPYPEYATEIVQAITIVFDDRIFTIGLKDYTPKQSNVWYRKCQTEEELLRVFLQIWEKLNLDIISGWYSNGFDMPYLHNRLYKVLGENAVKRLSPYKKVEQYGLDIDIKGIASLDLRDLYIKYAYNPLESYALNHVAHVDLGKKKLDYSEYGSLKTLYEENYELFIDYNIRDALLVKEINRKRNLLELAINLAYTAKVNYPDVMKQTRMWNSITYNYLKNKRKLIMPILQSSEKDRYEGAYVKAPRPSLYKWVMNYDLLSLYPSLIMQYNIGPDTYRGKWSVNIDDLIAGRPVEALHEAEKQGLSMAANGTYYTKEFKGFLSEIIDELLAERRTFKNKMLDTAREIERLKHGGQDTTELEFQETNYDIMQKGKKVGLNSLYGSFGNPGYVYYNVDQAEAVTSSGRLTIRWSDRCINKWIADLLKTTTSNDYVIYCDTDSMYLDMGSMPFLTKDDDEKNRELLDRFSKEAVLPFLETMFDDLYNYMGSFEQKMFMERENIARRAVWTGKKHYIMDVLDSEGVIYDQPKLKVVGMESVRTSTPEVVRNHLEEIYKIVLRKTEADVQAYVKKVKDEFKICDINDIAFPTGVNGIEKYSIVNYINGAEQLTYCKGAQAHIRGAIIYNNAIKQKNLTKTHDLIKSGDKVKYVYLKMPNAIKDNVISFPLGLPPELELEEYVDRKLMLEKAFMKPVTSMLNLVKWKPEKKFVGWEFA